ncbi:Sec23/Sec24 trunk domain containing protein [Histomonas meleagridis]|uniref:Sec23/Sec24 trunk domain containing protein n=1 Tax=Histomonas meleagridis TaxID=135588 RepID=UPI00355AB23C|nr:Sec23/Sec24 trunk domain containing protein [Histomonas meleagridis]KAH0805287.1 Sec23/Sec24 trunk domain containing protein [Histomonas meleagridis]
MNGIRFSWNVLPTNRQDANACSVPFGCVYTPLKQIMEHQPCQYEPVICQHCRAVLNPYSSINFNSKTWSCPICNSISPLPQSYHEMTETQLAAELLPEYSTIEYILNSPPTYPPIFIFVVDTCVLASQLPHLKTLLLQSISLLPPTSLVGFISYGNLVYIHELCFIECPRSYVFNGQKLYTPLQLQEYLSIHSNTKEIDNPFVIPMADAEQMLTSIIDNLEIDPFPVPKGQRSSRCTGAALDITISLLEALFPHSNTQIMLFTSGPITKGPGTMASLKVTDIVRQHKDIEGGNAPFYNESRKFFNEMAKRATRNNVVINYISASFEETGLLEISPVIHSTGGFLISAETYSDENISKSISKFFEGGILRDAGADGVITVHVSKQLRVSGCIGPCVSMEKPAPSVSEKPIGIGGTIQWKVSGILPSTSYTFFFDIYEPKNDPILAETQGYVQIVTQYRHITSGLMRLRVTTSPLKFSDLTTNQNSIEEGFDQQAAAIILSKLSMIKAETTDTTTAIRYLDSTLIRFSRKFGTYTTNQPQSFSFKQQFRFLPQFLFHLRRSPFLSTFNMSPDQTTSFRASLLREEVTNSLFMIQPTLLRYSLSEAPKPVILDISSLKPDCVLLLDTYFRVLIWHGSNIAAWRDQRYQEQPEYANLKSALEEPLEEAKRLLEERFPTPSLVVCDEDSSQSRYLLTKCNPSNDPSMNISFYDLKTDEQSLSGFLEHLKKLAVVDK